jgi:hypothetical protein
MNIRCETWGAETALTVTSQDIRNLFLTLYLRLGFGVISPHLGNGQWKNAARLTYLEAPRGNHEAHMYGKGLLADWLTAHLPA